MAAFVVRWNSARPPALVCKRQSNRKPYTQNVSEAKQWKTRKAAERWLALKDPLWASACTIEEV